MLRYLKYRVSDFFFLCVSLAAALALLYVITSVIAWAGCTSLLSALVSSEVFFAFKLSLATSLPATVSALVAGIPIAYAFSRYSFRGKYIIESLLMLPFAMPPIALDAALLIFFTNTAPGLFLNSLVRIVFEVPRASLLLNSL
ncbi:MAG: hypothetical protein J7J11_01205 [Desulfurococcales archaeon]|nr:hypothetical protein [Desulfurococcales archaeon]